MKKDDFKEMLKASFKSEETEEWLDVHFTRPIGLWMALIAEKLNITPNTISVFSILLGVASGVMFAHHGLIFNIIGILLLMIANFCDSADGQLARLTNQTTLTGRILDGFSGDLWFFAIYVGLAYRMTFENIPFTNFHWGILIWIICTLSGVICHSPQSSLADYYRQIHLYFLNGKKGSELDTYESQRKIYESLPKNSPWIIRQFFFNYKNYCRSQERRTPMFQMMLSLLKANYTDISKVPQDFKKRFLSFSRPLIKYTNILTFNTRAICIYVTCLLDCPWVYILIEFTIMNIIYVYMHTKHEKICRDMLPECGKAIIIKT
ncbi:MAG: CDP-alcohol phosphatidyltransferase family protein [Prevotella sp.]|nr:CDP-alcohol phosphatidyltransferase family protein [Prevotella sp.]